jgi:hypothetical protein
MLETILSIINFTGALYLLQNGQFFRTKYFKIASLFIAAYIIGILFKIIHFVFANELVTISSVAILLLYAKYFTTKPVKNKLEYLKLAWVVSTFSVGLVNLFHLSVLDLYIIPPVIMTFIVLEFFRKEKEAS